MDNYEVKEEMLDVTEEAGNELLYESETMCTFR
jgi:hypothetical protein